MTALRFSVCGWLVAMFAAAAACAVDPAPPGGQNVLPRGLAVIEAEDEDMTHGKSEHVDVEGQPFDRAMRVTCDQTGDRWLAEIAAPLPVDFKKGDVLLVRFRARSLETSHESGQSLFFSGVSLGREPWTEQFGQLMTVGKQWTHFNLRGRIVADYEPDDLIVKFSCGYLPQVVEFAGLEVLDYGQDVPLEQLPHTQPSYDGREADAPWRAEAQARIEQHRMAPLVIQVIDQQGQPVAGVGVKAELTRHAFDFGAAVAAAPIADPNATGYRANFLRLFNAGTLYNGLKWEAWDGHWGPDLERPVTMKALRWFKEQGIKFRGHVLVWPGWDHLPDTVDTVRDSDPAVLERLVQARIDSTVLTTLDYVSEWDVINEPYHNHDLMDLLGKQVMVDWFERARARAPHAKLALNDFGILTETTDTPHHADLVQQVQYLLDHDAPVDVLGLQGHFAASVPSPMRVKEVLDRFAAFGLPIRVTEYTIASQDPDLQYDFTRDFLTLAYSHPDVLGVQLWGMETAFNDNGSFTPIGRAIDELVHQKWQTNLDATTDDNGTVESPAHLGTYHVTVTHGDQTQAIDLELRRGDPPLLIKLEP